MRIRLIIQGLREDMRLTRNSREGTVKGSNNSGLYKVDLYRTSGVELKYVKPIIVNKGLLGAREIISNARIPILPDGAVEDDGRLNDGFIPPLNKGSRLMTVRPDFSDSNIATPSEVKEYVEGLEPSLLTRRTHKRLQKIIGKK